VDVLVGSPLEVSTAPGRTGLAEATEQIRSALARLILELDGARAGEVPAREVR
jgi:1-acyl-sn-glycerol-3-phosphate acyltransferase